MEFKTDVFSLLPSKNKSIPLTGLVLPNNKDVFYRAKQKEIIEQYATARTFLVQTHTDDWKYWFAPTEHEDANTYFKLTFISRFYEAALIFYNIVVDLSWTICYLAAEFALYKDGKSIDFSNMTSIEDAIKLIRSAERNVTNPTAETTPFIYLKQMNPAYKKAIDLVCEFWEQFCNSDIRRTYNFIKHKGKPLYDEIAAVDDTRFFSFVQKKFDGSEMQMVSDIQDVQHRMPLFEPIEKLLKFDDEKLFPYLQQLFNYLESIDQPSPLI